MAQREYITVNKKDHPRANSSGHVLLHILVAEEKLGRKLKPGETVHHVDENKMNNDPDNLIVFATLGDHSAFHSGSDIYKDGDVWRAIRCIQRCPTCGKEIRVSKNKFGKEVRYCSPDCARKGLQRTVDTDEIILKLKENNGNFTRAANELNVSSNALVHRLKRAGLPYHSKDYRQ